MEIEAVSEVTATLVDSIAALIPQLSSSAAAPRKGGLQRVVGSSATALLIAKADDIVKGMLTLAVFHVPTGARAIIEDVVVDERHRGQGIAAALVQNALARAEAAGARTVDLTSRPSREAANRLYRKLGFEQRETNVYRFSFGK
ncbi:GNAT family N-acetyltransferase [Mesorhizobium camelthorni]|uniref:GNAT family N-acetyltransferase n=2 Tax=Allomesorhizobium camelthorni TaxID=475069 RepID=A0A6G4W5R5_9HYPH|nr:GNAT family N-acetyltransferase [Mesorhizobium camelthorni]